MTALTIATVMIVQCLSFEAPGAQAALSDIGTSPYRESIEYLAAKKLVSGNPNGSFAPDRLMTRAEFITIMVRAFGTDAEASSLSNCFQDVRDEWFAKYICYAKEHQIIQGYPDGFFRPTGNVSYVEAISMAVSAAKISVVKASGQQAWYEPYLDFAHNNTIFSKYAMLPATALTRGKASFAVHQILLLKSGEKKIRTVRENLSAGCGVTPPATAPTSLMVNGVSRKMITDIPSTYVNSTPLKLVFGMHGRTNSNEMVRSYFRLGQATNGEAILVYPSGIKSGSVYSWSSSDFPFFDAILENLSKQYCIDLDEVFVVGHSLGGWMTSELACSRGDVIRGIAQVGGGATKRTSCSGPVAAMIWHNPKDNLVGFSQGLIARDNIRLQNQLGAATTPAEPSFANCVKYAGSLSAGFVDAPLIWCPHTQDYEDYGARAYYPHVWPKAAGGEMWKFFKAL